MSSPDIKLGIFASGSGSTANVLLDKASVVITNRKEAFETGIGQKVRDYNKENGTNIPCIYLPRIHSRIYLDDGTVDQLKTNENYGFKILDSLDPFKVDYLSLNGFDVILPNNVVSQFEDRVANSHPAPLRAGSLGFGGKGFHGLVPHAAVQYFFENINRPFKTEVTLHIVTKHYDDGPELAFCEVELFRGESPQDLQNRVKKSEIGQLRPFWNKVEKDGRLVPLPSRGPLILPDEYSIWVEARSYALRNFSH